MSKTINVEIPIDEHVFIAGMTGSGKSIIAEYFLRDYEYVIKLDTKGEYHERIKKGIPIWDGLEMNKDYTVIFHLADIEYTETKKIIYCPVFEEQNEEYYNALFKYVYERENTILWIDELMSICDNPRKYPLYLKALYTRGRSKNAVVWALTQRPVDIPTICTSNSSNFFVFNLMLDIDRDKMAKVTGVNDFYTLPKGHNFWYYRFGDEHATLCCLDLERG